MRRPKLPRLLRRAGRLDPLRWPHEYIGPRNAWGLRPGPCRIEKRWAGGYVIRTPEGRFTVAKAQVVPAR